MRRIGISVGAWRSLGVQLLRRAASLRIRQEGNAAIEFALVVPILMILLTGSADYALMANQKVALQAATRGAAEWAQQNPSTCSGSCSAAASYGNFPTGVTPSVSLVCTCVDNSSVACSGGTCNVGGDIRVVEYVQVSATQTFTPWISYTGFGFPSQINASTTLRAQ